MARLSKEEEKKKHLSELNKTRMQRYREKHIGTYKRVNADISIEKYNKFVAKLEKDGITQKQVIEAAIDNFLAN